MNIGYFPKKTDFNTISASWVDKMNIGYFSQDDKMNIGYFSQKKTDFNTISASWVGVSVVGSRKILVAEIKENNFIASDILSIWNPPFEESATETNKIITSAFEVSFLINNDS